ncbi:uncharacterized protein LOC128998061 [Macrosteles quadrilineatus]|uniref:uncharacterized protein LOC128998061 n=1 Tax=Macrosteles quadrilineatus TaxID=74068 RepID=UPI0023E338C7|nr:uncharacterized protein LOC128998061 [Macrosteles quadrilineatus]
MFSQSFNCLPSKKQPIFGNQSPQNMELLRGLTSKPYQDPANHISMHHTVSNRNHTNFGTGSIKLMDFVYSFTETSRLEFGRRYVPTFSVPSEKMKLSHKDIIGLPQTNPMTPSLVRSYVVGGFVGSKSQLGRKRKNDVGKLNLWDMIRDLVNLVGSAPNHFSPRPTPNSTPHLNKNSEIMLDSSLQKGSSVNSTVAAMNCTENPPSSTKQSYADVAKGSSKHNSPKIIPETEVRDIIFPMLSDTRCDSTISVMEPVSIFIKPDCSSRDRITSECSADSEDSYIVFECSEDDNVDKDIFSSDDDTISVDEVSQSDSGIVPSSNSSFCNKTSPKKVRFAEDDNLVKIHPMVTWDYAYRMARRGPWEMLARDSERFKLRIARTEAVLKPILDPQHRSVVYRDRFSELER